MHTDPQLYDAHGEAKSHLTPDGLLPEPGILLPPPRASVGCGAGRGGAAGATGLARRRPFPLSATT
jgi:hypothetical protein